MIKDMNLSFAQVLVRFDFSPECSEFIVFEKMLSSTSPEWKIVGRMSRSGEDA